MVRSEARTTKESADTYLSFDTMAFFDLAVGSRGGREAVTKRWSSLRFGPPSACTRDPTPFGIGGISIVLLRYPENST